MRSTLSLLLLAFLIISCDDSSTGASDTPKTDIKGQIHVYRDCQLIANRSGFVVTEPASGRQATTDSLGKFTLKDIGPGFYRLKVTKDGYWTQYMQSEVYPNLKYYVNDAYMYGKSAIEVVVGEWEFDTATVLRYRDSIAMNQWGETIRLPVYYYALDTIVTLNTQAMENGEPLQIMPITGVLDSVPDFEPWVYAAEPLYRFSSNENPLRFSVNQLRTRYGSGSTVYLRASAWMQCSNGRGERRSELQTPKPLTIP